jgi:vacuolar-type H+-ATPase subunit I/STV1
LRKIRKIDKPLARLTRGHRDNIEINKIRNENGDLTTETEEIKKKYEILYSTKLESLDEMDDIFRQIPSTKFKSGSDKSSKQSHNA